MSAYSVHSVKHISVYIHFVVALEIGGLEDPTIAVECMVTEA